MDLKRLADAGLYDPDSPYASDRLALIEWLLGRGVTIEQMIARGGVSLSGLAGDLALRPGARRSAREIAAETGIELDTVMSLALASGFPPAGPDDPAFADPDLALFMAYAGGAAMFGEAGTRRFTRVMGSSMSRIAEAAVTLFQTSVEQPILESGGSELAIAQQNVNAVEALTGVRVVLDGLFANHVETAIRRLREARSHRMPDRVRFAVGFVDLVGFTTLTQNMGTRELAVIVERFEETACDVVAASDGRVVKLIGDEIMFVTRDCASACRTALTLFERFADDEAITPRGALAYGELLALGGDYYGPIVNLSSRIAQIAVPGELLVTKEVADAAAAADLAFEPAGKRLLKGFDSPFSLLSVSRAAGSGTDTEL